jgi:hypothetical protein
MSRSVAAAVLVCACAGAAVPAFAQTQVVANGGGSRTDRVAVRPPAVGAAVRVAAAAPDVDGRLDEPVWATAPVMSEFTQRDPDEGQPASERTEVRVTYTDDALYVGVRAFDREPARIAAQLTRRDSWSPSDWIAVGIDSYHDRRTGFVFQVNPAGVKRDSYIFNDTEEDDSWDAVWDVAVSRDAEGWTAEFRIPFSQLRFARADAHTFGFQVHRVINRRNETQQWRYIPKNEQGQVSLWGELRGIEGLRPPRRLEVLPYTVARGQRYAAEERNPFRTGASQSATIGADVKYGITSNITLDLTLNPDFGQVEQDPAFVNLSAYEQYQSERRPFFTEGVNLFRFGLGLGDGDGANEQLFYSRRVGRPPQGSPSVPDSGFAEPVDHTAIRAAAKLSGKTPGGWSVGLLSAITGPERAAVDSFGVRRFETVEPATAYLVGRLARDFRAGHTVVGAFATALRRDLPSQLDWLRSDAYAMGLDFNHRFASGAYRVTAKLIGSNVRGSREAILATQTSSARYYQRPDNDYTEVDSAATSLSGLMAQATIGKERGAWMWVTGVDTRTPGFEVNDMGFMREADYISQFGWLAHRWTRPGRVFRRAQINFNQWSNFNYGGERGNLGGNINAHGTLLNYWYGGGGINRNLGGVSNELRGGPAILRPGNWNGWGYFGSDERKALRVNVNAGFFSQDEHAAAGWWSSTYLAYRPSGQVDLSVGPSVNVTHDQWQYLTAEAPLGTTEYIFGELEQTTVDMGVRANITFSPALTLQLYAAPFYAAGRFPAVKRVADPRGASFADRFDVLGADRATRTTSGDWAIDLDRNDTTDLTVGNPDFGVVSFRSNAVLRWEYRPGSTLFLVWQQNRGDFTSDGRYQPREAYRRLRGTRPENVFLVKLNYWLSL